MRCRRDGGVLTRLEVGEPTPRLSSPFPLLVGHGVLALLGNTEVYCSVLVISLSLSLSLQPPPHLLPSLSYSPPLSLCYVSEALSALHIILPTLPAAPLSYLHLYLVCPMGHVSQPPPESIRDAVTTRLPLWQTRLRGPVMLDGIVL